ncbi:DUF1499 domain-containing protein [Balneatrix alpica]|uniref:DUF1499 domain-containing protein n=1 Tax=Balneatrix alpica TaxID=75684 RepID=A0ABV5ZAM2_9GAMM|nr:DUF1499 domain-containing protein [Balneatrix alpica]
MSWGKRILLGLVALLGVVLVVLLLRFWWLAMDSRQGQAMGLDSAGELQACPNKPNCVLSTATDASHIAPLPLQQDVSASWVRLQQLIQAQGGELKRVEEDYLAAEFQSALFGFVDDLEAKLDASNGVIQLRSASRVGYSDLGVNRKRIEAIRQQWRME